MIPLKFEILAMVSTLSYTTNNNNNSFNPHSSKVASMYRNSPLNKYFQKEQNIYLNNTNVQRTKINWSDNQNNYYSSSSSNSTNQCIRSISSSYTNAGVIPF